MHLPTLHNLIKFEQKKLRIDATVVIVMCMIRLQSQYHSIPRLTRLNIGHKLRCFITG